ncbi:MAG: NAD(P)-dependent methylenetetrahydromethanopterin dehydrogenase, partial [Methylocella sp.]
MTKKLLFLLDTDPAPSVFDTVVGYDGGADHVIGYGGVTPESVAALVDGTIYTRGPKEKQCTAIFVGGGSMIAGEAVFAAVKKRFFANFRVSAMLDSNGSNTTAAAGVALLAKAKPLAGKKAVVLGGTGPVGMRAAAMLHSEDAEVAITSRSQQRADAASKAINDRFGFAPRPIEAFDNEARAAAVKGAQIVFAAGAIGVPLLDERDWRNEPAIELIADCNAQPPLGIGGIEAIDKG